MKLRYRVGIATKMILIVTLIVVGSIGAVVYVASDLFQEDSVTRIQEINKETAQHLGERVQSVFEDAFNRLTLMAQFATRSATKEEAVRAISNTLGGSDDIVSFIAYQVNDQGQLIQMYTVVQDTILAEFNLTADQLRDWPRDFVLNEQMRDIEKVNVVNSAPYLKIPLFTMTFISKDLNDKFVPSNISSKDKLLLMKGRWFFRAEIRQDPILQMFSSKKFQISYLVDRAGKLLAHSDPEWMPYVVAAYDMSTQPIVWRMLESDVDVQQMEYVGDDSEAYLGAYKKTSVSGIGVITEVQKNQALATINRVQYRSFLVMIIVVCLAFVLNFLFSQSLTSPIRQLFEATEQVVMGNYNVSIRGSTADEIGALSHAFKNMTDGLKEREKLKGAFSKFHSKEVAKKLLAGEIKLGGERKHVTVFFSDIRGFTEMSEKMTPDQVVAMLNEYMTEMVKIIYKWQGVVDKYIGDSIMAEWGVPDPKPEDAYNSVRAALEMRAYMLEFNRRRQEKGLQSFDIGIGLHSGEVLAGNIGSEERLEYTVIGDTVNQAARIEAATKPVNSDFLISENTYLLVKDKGILCGPEIKIKAKGKSEPLKVYQVIGYMEQDQKLSTVLTESQIQKIQSAKSLTFNQDEEKVSVASETTAVADLNRWKESVPAAQAAPIPVAVVPTEGGNWFLVDPSIPEDVQGPFSMNEIILKAKSLQIDAKKMHAFQEGDSATTPVFKLSGMQRKPMPPINEPIPGPEYHEGLRTGEWYVHGPSGTILGPVTQEQLWLALDQGNITRTTWVWTLGYDKWIYVFQVPEFDRRNVA